MITISSPDVHWSTFDVLWPTLNFPWYWLFGLTFRRFYSLADTTKNLRDNYFLRCIEISAQGFKNWLHFTETVYNEDQWLKLLHNSIGFAWYVGILCGLSNLSIAAQIATFVKIENRSISKKWANRDFLWSKHQWYLYRKWHDLSRLCYHCTCFSATEEVVFLSCIWNDYTYAYNSKRVGAL